MLIVGYCFGIRSEHLPEPPEADELCNTTRIIAVGLVPHGAESCFHMAAL
jgi:hypothetical protein